MGKLTSLLKKKKSRGDGLTSSDLQEKADSTLSGISVETAPPLSLSIPATSMGEGTSSDIQASFSLMNDIMDELAGTTPDTPQPTLASPSSSDFSDKDLTASSGQSNAASSTVASKIGKLEQNRAFKDNTFLRNQQQSRQSNILSSTSSSAQDRLSNKKVEEAERAAEAAARLREASKKANAQLPSDDEGSSSSDSDGSDDGLSPRRRRQQQQQLLQMQQQAMLLQQQQQQQQQLPYQTGESFVSNAGSPHRSDGGSKKPRPINHEAVIDRMKDRHRALLAGAAAAARDEYYEEYMDDYGFAQPLQPPGPIGYNMQYGVDPNLMYGVDEFRMKQQQQQQQLQQQYYGQGGALPSHPYGPSTPPLSTVLPAGYSYTSSGPMPPIGYNSSGAGVYQGQPMSFAGSRGPAMVQPNHLPGFAREYGSDVSSSHSNSVNNGETTMMPAGHQRFRQQSTASSARASEDSWADPYPVLSSAGSAPPKPYYYNESGHGGMIITTAAPAATQQQQQQVQRACEDSMIAKDTTTVTPEDDVSNDKTEGTVDDLTKAVEELAIAQAEGTDAGAEADTEDAPGRVGSERYEGEKLEQPLHAQPPQQIAWSNGSSETLEAPEESPKGCAANEPSHHHYHPHPKDSSPTMSAHDQESNDCESSDDDDQPIILSRRGSARGSFPFLMPTKTHMDYPLSGSAGVDGLDDVMPVIAMMSGQQVPFMMAQSKNMYQPVQTPTQQHGPFVSQPMQQQQQPLQYMSMGYPFPGSQQPASGPVSNLNMGHHHSYSMDRIPANMMMSGAPIGNNTMAHMARRGHTMPYGPSSSSSGPKDLRQAAMTANGYGAVAAAAAAAPIQSPYPIPPTTLLHPLPRRTQSARLRSQNPAAGSPQQQQQPFGVPSSAMMRGRNSLEYARCMPNGNYQAVPSEYMNGGGGGYMRGYVEPLSSPPQQYQQQLQLQYQQGYPMHQQQQQQQQQGPIMTTSPPQSHSLVEVQQQQHQQGCFVANSHFGYAMHPSETYMIPPHQQPILQGVRR
ncbi:hypothetical protein BGZ67_004767 [Mortierella alpina]|nr:hypothetical protein BGZ67_004767 [Mortierella alpina]